MPEVDIVLPPDPPVGLHESLGACFALYDGEMGMGLL